LIFREKFDCAMKGWVMVRGEGFTTEKELTAWMEKAKAFAKTLAPK